MKQQGFSLVELMVVVAIIGILGAIAVPNFRPFRARAQLTEINNVLSYYKPTIAQAYFGSGRFPANNAAAKMPPPDKILGHYITSVTLEDGAFHVTLGNKIFPEANGKTISIRPLIVPGSPRSPIAWLCGRAEVPAGMQAHGEDRTDVPSDSDLDRC